MIDRLAAEHLVIHDVLEERRRRAGRPRQRLERLHRVSTTRVDLLSDTMNSHLAYEERELVEPLARLGFYAGQI